MRIPEVPWGPRGLPENVLESWWFWGSPSRFSKKSVLPFGGNPETVFLGKGCDFNGCMLLFRARTTDFCTTFFFLWNAHEFWCFEMCDFCKCGHIVLERLPILDRLWKHFQTSTMIVEPYHPFRSPQQEQWNIAEQGKATHIWKDLSRSLFFRVYLTDYASNLWDPKNEGYQLQNMINLEIPFWHPQLLGELLETLNQHHLSVGFLKVQQTLTKTTLKNWK